MNFKAGIILFFALGLCAQTAMAFPMPPRQMTFQDFAQIRPSGVLDGPANFHAIVALSNCSGSLVRFENSLQTDPALILTNGHCFEGGFPKAGEVRVDLPSTRTFALLNNDGTKFGSLTANRVIVNTMTKTDITLYQLNQTYADIIQKYQVQPLVIANQHPVPGTAIAVVSGYWKRIYSCKVDTFIYELREANWTFLDSIRYTQPGCEVIGGTSGSPIINTANDEIIGINNTTNEDGQRCTMDNPCEVDQKGNITVVLHAAYGQETFWLYSCLDAQRHFNLNQPNCALHP